MRSEQAPSEDQAQMFDPASTVPPRPWHQTNRPRTDPGAPTKAPRRADAADTSIAAAKRAYPRTGTNRLRVLRAIIIAGERGLTDFEISDATGMIPNSERPSRVSLVEQEWIADSGRRRPSPTGSPAIVWTLTDGASAMTGTLERIRRDG